MAIPEEKIKELIDNLNEMHPEISIDADNIVRVAVMNSLTEIKGERYTC